MTEGWHDFFVANVGAAAALAGLIIVAMSVNIEAIIKIPVITARAGATVASLVLSLVSGGIMLIPAQNTLPLGAAILVAAVITGVIVTQSAVQVVRVERRHRPPMSTTAKVVVAAIQVLPFGVGAVLLLTGNSAGIAWIASGVLLVFAGSATNAWVLLVEILR